MFGRTPKTFRCQYQQVGIQKPLLTLHEPLWTQCEQSQTQREPRCELVEYSLCWVHECWVRIAIGHVNFRLFVSFLFALGTPRKLTFWWNMGLQVHENRRNQLRIDKGSPRGALYLGAYLGKGPYWQLITLCWLYFGVMFQT